jgi:hypothetical protein
MGFFVGLSENVGTFIKFDGSEHYFQRYHLE